MTTNACYPWTRLRVAVRLLCGLRTHDLRAARTFMKSMYSGQALPMRLARLLWWAAGQVFHHIPNALSTVTRDIPLSRTPIWLVAGNPLANHPWGDDPEARLPDSVEVAVIGAGFTGAGCAYHWSRAAGAGSMAVLEMDDPASGASGRNEGLVVMGRYFAMVRDTVRPYLREVRPDLTPEQQKRLAGQFAAAYVHSAYRNGDLVEQTIRDEGFDCGYARNGWIQARDDADQPALQESIGAGQAHGFDDWTSLSPEETLERGGMRVDAPAGFSRAAASFHPAKWVWCLLERALQHPQLALYTRTRVQAVHDEGEHYRLCTDRGDLRARFVINATESYTAALHPRYGEFIYPVQTQAAFGRGGPEAMQPHIGLSGKRGFFGRHRIEGYGDGVMVGSDATRVPAHRAGVNDASRFITEFLLGELHAYFGRSSLHLTHEWSGTPGFTVDEFPVVGLLDCKRQYIIGGMCGSGSGVSFNAARHVVGQVLGQEGPDDYPVGYFAPSRILDPQNHPWPEVESGDIAAGRFPLRST